MPSLMRIKYGSNLYFYYNCLDLGQGQVMNYKNLFRSELLRDALWTQFHF